MEENKERVKFRGEVSKIFAPKCEEDRTNGKWYSLSVKVIEDIKGRTKPNPIWQTVKVVGNMPTMVVGEEYEFSCYENVDTKYGLQYATVFVKRTDIVLQDDANGKDFLRRVMTEKQFISLYELTDTPIKYLEAGDIDFLAQGKGFGKASAEKLVKKYEMNKGRANEYIELAPYDLTDSEIERIVKAYGDTLAAKNAIERDVYSLIKTVDGIGFKKADDIAMRMGMDKNDPRRVKAYIVYLLETVANDEGSTWVWLDNLIDQCVNVLEFPYYTEKEMDDADDRIIECIKEMLDQDIIWSDTRHEKIALVEYRTLERNIAKELIRIKYGISNLTSSDVDGKLNELGEKQGWFLNEQQVEGAKAVVNESLVVSIGKAGCVDCDTEYFNGSEWVKISEYKQGDKVLQYNKDGTAELVYPTDYIKLPEETLYHFKTKYGLNQCLSLEHRVIYRTSKGHLAEITMEELMKRHEENSQGFSGRFYTTFNYEGGGINLTDEEIRVMCAVICDGTFNKERDSNWCRINLKKQRKKDRIKLLLEKAKIPYEIEEKHGTGEGYTVYKFYAPRREKVFTSYWYNCNKEQFKVICDEINNWDGSFKKQNCFSTSIKETADFIQFAYACIGERATIKTADRIGEKYKNGYIRKSLEYTVNHTSRNIIGMCNKAINKDKKVEISPYKTKDGFKYCFKVPSTMLVLRRGDRIFITGNSGKTSSINGGIESFDTPPVLSQCALSGKCADNLKNVTGREASTIHRLLGFNPAINGFCYDKDYKLNGEMFILDEVGMCNLRILYSLLQAIPIGAKLVMLGDTAQLPPIGVGNFLQDVIKSGVITVNELTKVNRQAEGSRIKTLSFDIASGKQFYKKGEQFEREEGDLKTIIYNDKTLIPERVIREFFKMKQDENAQIEDMAIICSTREKGALSCLALNRQVQDRLINKQARGDKYAVKNENRDNEIRFYEGDRILNEKNNYKVPIYSPKPNGELWDVDEDGNPVTAPLFNGQVGTVTKVIRGDRRKNDFLIVEFDTSYEPLVIDMGLLNNCSLGYALTVHKIQGLTVPYTICAFDYSAYKMLSKELVYTALTRAKKKAIIVAEGDALRYAIGRSAIVNVNTFLKDFLIEEDNKVKNGEIVFETKNEVRAIVPPPRLSDDDITYPCELEDCEDMEGEDFAKDYELSLDDLILRQNDIFDK